MAESSKRMETPVPAPRRNVPPRSTPPAYENTILKCAPILADNLLYFSVDDVLVDTRQTGVSARRPTVTQSLIDEFDPLAQTSPSNESFIGNGHCESEKQSTSLQDVILYDVPHNPPEPSFTPPPLPKLRQDTKLPNLPEVPARVQPIPLPMRAGIVSSSGSSVYESALESISEERAVPEDNVFENTVYLCGSSFGDSVFYDIPNAVEDAPPDLPPRFNLNTVVPPMVSSVQTPPVPPRKPPMSHFTTEDSMSPVWTSGQYDEVEDDLPLPENKGKKCDTKANQNFGSQSGASFRSANKYEDCVLRDSCHSLTSEGSDNNVLHITSKLGWLQRIIKNKKESTKCWCVLTKDTFSIHNDRFDNKPVTFAAGAILTVECKDQAVNSTTGPYCFDVVVRGVKNDQACMYRFSVITLTERLDWVTCLWKCITLSEKIADRMLSAVIKAGRFEYKEAVSGIWQPVWLALMEHSLIIWLTDESNEMVIDLRKVKAIDCVLCTGHHKRDPRTEHSAVEGCDGTVFHVMSPGKTIYLRSYASSETDDMFKKAKVARLATGDKIEDQFLTQEDVPVLVDKCMTHIFVNGLQVEGIYRIAARCSAVDSLLDSLRRDPFQVNLSQDYTIHEVANAVKRFFIKLPNPLLTNELAAEWQTVYAANEGRKADMCKAVVARLPHINFQTLRHLLAHLRSVIYCKDTNAMSARNVAAVFGPTLLGNFACEGLKSSQELLNIGMHIMMYLLSYYENIFDVDESALQREKVMLKLVQQTQLKRGNSFMQKKASNNGLLISVYVDSKDWGDCIPFTVMPKMTAKDVVLEVMRMKNKSKKIVNLMLCEVVCNGELERLVHFNELVLEVMSRWLTWDDEERRGNYFLVKNNGLYSTLLPLKPYLMSLSCEVRLADAKTKTFKKAMLEFKNAKLSYYKDNKLSQPIGCWNIEDVAWYVGCESKRNAPSSFVLTFIERNTTVKRTKSSPYFGMAVCMNNEDDLHKWMATMLVGEHPGGLIPS